MESVSVAKMRRRDAEKDSEEGLEKRDGCTHMKECACLAGGRSRRVQASRANPKR